MSLEKKIVKQISEITIKLISTSFSIRENQVAKFGNDIRWSGFKDISFTLKKQPYEFIYNQCLLEKAYNFILIDNAIIQLLYRIENGEIISHRLAYLPHPNYIKYQDLPEDFEDLQFGTELFTEIIERRVVTIPLRFDFDIDDSKFVEFDHPKAHITLGNYKDCRIPTLRPISPNRFMQFILRSFYLKRFKEFFSNKDFCCDLNFPETISPAEKETTYFST